MPRMTAAQLAALFPNNTTGLISPADLRDFVDTVLQDRLDDHVFIGTGGTTGWSRLGIANMEDEVQNGLVTGGFSLSGRVVTLAVEGSRANPSFTLPVDNDTLPNAPNVLSALQAMTTSQESSARDALNSYGVVNYGSIPNDTALSTITGASATAGVRGDHRTSIFVAGSSFTTTNAFVQSDQRNISANDVYMWGITATDSTFRWRRILSAAVYAQAGGGGGGGLNQRQVDARVVAGVLAWARASNTDTIPQAKLSGATIVAVLEALAAGSRLSYTRLDDTPNIPTLRTAAQTRDLLAGLNGNARLGRAAINFGGNTTQLVLGDGSLAARPTIPTLRTAAQTRDLLGTLTGNDRLGRAAINFGGTSGQVVRGDGSLGTGGGGGLASVSSDTTLTGTGTSADPLSVANPFTDADETKLDGIAENANNFQLNEHQREVFGAFSGNAWEVQNLAANLQPYIGSESRATNYGAIPTGITYAATQPSAGPRLTNVFVAVRVPLALEPELHRYRLRVGGGAGVMEDPGMSRILSDHAVLIARDATYAYYNYSIANWPAADALFIDRFDPFDIVRGRIDIDLSDLADTPNSYADAEAGDALILNAAKDGIIFGDAPVPDIAAGTGEIDEAPGSRTLTNEAATANWQAPTLPFNFESNVSYMFIARVGGLTYGDLITSDALTRLTEGTAGQSSAGAGQAYEIPMGTNALRIGRQSGNRLLFAVQTAATIQSLRIVKLQATSGLAESAPAAPVYDELTTTVTLPAPTALDTWGAWAEVRRWTNSGTETQYGFYGWDLNPQATFTPSGGGDRAGAEFRVQHFSSTGTLIREVMHPTSSYIRNNGQTGSVALAKHGYNAWMVPVDLAPGEYLLIDGHASVQVLSDPLPNTKTVELLAAEQNFWFVERGGGISVGGGGAQGQTGSSPATGSFTRTFITRSATTPRFTATFNGSTFDDLNGWQSYTGRGVYPPGTDPLYITDVLVFRTTGTATGWGVNHSPPQPLGTTQWAHDNPRTTPATVVTTTEVVSGPNISNWRRVWSGTAYGPWREIDPQQSIAYHDFVSGNYYALTRGTGLRLPFTAMNLHEIVDLRGHVSFYTIGGLVAIGGIPFEISPQQELSHPVDRSDTISASDGAYTAIFDQSGNETLTSFFLKHDATYNFGAGQYGVLGLQFQFQRPTGMTTGTIADSVLVGNPTTFDSLRRVRMGIDLWAR